MSAQTASPERLIYLAACKLQDPEVRREYLDEACGTDQILRKRLDLLLGLESGEGKDPLHQALRDLGHSPVDNTPNNNTNGKNGRPTVRQIDETVDARINISQHPVIGRYKLLEELGSGGMGAVYMAQQTAPVKRKVALKIIKPGMDSREVIARFQAERQALAMMDHPNIARVLDAGTTDEGRPYFVMELVRGIPITKFCEQKKFSLQDRLKLFIDVCKAVQHAHQKAIIHRDLKPSNILVTLHDGEPVVKVIDFGVAKALNQDLTDQTLFTQFSQMIGTPLYMSPEQAEMSGLDVDTRSDVYSLGVVLYELLTSTTPIERESLAKLGYDAVRKLVMEQEPERPSSRISTLKAGGASTVSAAKRHEQQIPAKQLNSELDWIVMKALEKDRSRRYETANGLAADVQRYLNAEPVEACPPSLAYRLSKFAERNRAAFTAAVLVASVLIIGIAGTSWQAIRATQSEKDAENERDRADRLRIAAQQQQQVAEENFQRARATVDEYLTRVSENKLLNSPGMQPLRKDLLKLALKYYQEFVGKHANDDELQAELANAHYRLGEISRELGNRENSISQHQRALEIRQQLAERSPEDQNTQYALAQSIFESRLHTRQIALAIDRTNQAIGIAESLENPQHRTTLAKYYRHLAMLCQLQFKQYGGTEKLDRVRAALDTAEKIVSELNAQEPAPRYSKLLADLYTSRAVWHETMGNSADEEALNQRSIAIYEELTKKYPENLEYQEGLGIALFNVGHHEQSLQIYQKLTSENPSVVLYRHELADLYARVGAINNEPDKLVKAIEIFERLEQDFPNEMFGGLAGAKYERLGRMHSSAGRLEEAIKAFQSAIERLRGLEYYQGHLSDAYSGLGAALERAGRIDEAIAARQADLEVGRWLVKESPQKLRYRWVEAGDMRALAGLMRRAGRDQEALETYQSAIDLLLPVFTDGQTTNALPPDIHSSRALLPKLYQDLAECLDELDRPDDAEDKLREALEFLTQSIERDPVDPTLWESRAKLHFALGIEEKGRADLTHALPLARKAVEADPSDGPAWDAWHSSAMSHYRERDWEGAELEAELAVELAENNTAKLLLIASFFLLADQEEEFHELCGQILAMQDEWKRNAHFGQAIRLVSSDVVGYENTDRLMQFVERASNEGPRFAEPEVAIIYARLGHRDAARAAWDRTALENPDYNPNAHEHPLEMLNEALFRTLMGEHELAKPLFEQGKQLAESFDFQYATGRMHTAIRIHELEHLLQPQVDTSSIH